MSFISGYGQTLAFADAHEETPQPIGQRTADDDKILLDQCVK